MSTDTGRGQRLLVTKGRLPYPSEVFERGARYTGLPGFEYCFVNGSNIGHYIQSTAGEAKRMRWQIMDGTPIIQIEATNGGGGYLADNIMVLCRGERIWGADPSSAVCQWYADDSILEALGLLPPSLDGTPSASKFAKSEPLVTKGAPKGEAA